MPWSGCWMTEMQLWCQLCNSQLIITKSSCQSNLYLIKKWNVYKMGPLLQIVQNFIKMQVMCNVYLPKDFGKLVSKFHKNCTKIFKKLKGLNVDFFLEKLWVSEFIRCILLDLFKFQDPIQLSCRMNIFILKEKCHNTNFKLHRPVCNDGWDFVFQCQHFLFIYWYSV